ncbi:hypothetical protein [Streptomyces sp. NPDC001568]|uniref:hypothetical protein n=1 Tax=Streptomyces sp. NPDC001568 TaxID=3364588 RepID=UPI0036816F5D
MSSVDSAGRASRAPRSRALSGRPSGPSSRGPGARPRRDDGGLAAAAVAEVLRRLAQPS